MGANGDNRPGQRLAAVAASSEGIVSIDELRECGIGRRSVAARHRDGTLHRVFRGVYAVGHMNLSPTALCIAAAKACGPGSAVAFAPAAAYWGWIGWDQARTPEILIMDTTPRVHQGIWLHRTIRLPESHTRSFGPVMVTSPARTIADLGGRWDQRRVTEMVRMAQFKQRVSPQEIIDTIVALGRRRGRKRVLNAVAHGPAPTRTVLENVVLDMILRAGIAHPDVNRPLVVEGRKVIPDFRWPSARLTVEADSWAWHSGPEAQQRDAERETLLTRFGDRVERVTWRQAVTGPEPTAARLIEAGAPLG